MSTNTLTQTEQLKRPINISEIEVGDIFSEESHYVYLGQKSGLHQFKHLESGQEINLDDQYVTNLLETADQFDETQTIEVGVEDKFWTAKQIEDAKKKGLLAADSTVREGDLKLKGMRNIWADIHSTKVFTVCFDKKGKALTKKAFTQAKEKQVQDALASIGTGKITMEDAFKQIQENPIVPIEAGEERQLRGYKVQFSSINGVYDVVDMDIVDDGKGSNLRKVNINEIKWLVIGGVQYVRE